MKIHGKSVMSDYIPSMRAAISDVWIPQYRKTIRRELKKQAKEAAEIIERNGKIEEHATRWTQDMIKVQIPIALAMSIDGYHLTEAEFGKTGYFWRQDETEEIFEKSKKILGKIGDLDIGFSTDELLARKMQPDVENFVTTRTKSMTATSLERMSNLIQIGLLEELTVIELAASIERGMKAQSAARAELIARSATIWNYNHAAQFGYADAGISEKAWLVTDDDVLCEFCRPMEAEVAGIMEGFRDGGSMIAGDQGGSLTLGFGVEHPPLHPNCRCAIIGVI